MSKTSDWAIEQMNQMRDDRLETLLTAARTYEACCLSTSKIETLFQQGINADDTLAEIESARDHLLKTAIAWAVSDRVA